jgi:hypothetical protein
MSLRVPEGDEAISPFSGGRGIASPRIAGARNDEIFLKRHDAWMSLRVPEGDEAISPFSGGRGIASAVRIELVMINHLA